MGCLVILFGQEVARIVLVICGAIKVIIIGAIACRRLYLAST